jgi:hydrogenase expression/formation protein HypC
MQVAAIRPDGSGDVELDGVTRSVRLCLVHDVRPGDFVIVHAGYAIEKLDPDEADVRLRLIEELLRPVETPAP